MSTVMELPTLDSLRDEQRSLRAQLARLRRRLQLQLALELAADAAVVLTVTAAVLVFLDWWFRFGLSGPPRLARRSECRGGSCAPRRSRGYGGGGRRGSTSCRWR